MRAYGAETSSLLVAIFVLSLLAFTSASHAEGQRGDRHSKGFGANGQMFTERMAKRLDLDDTQRQSVDNILQAAKPEMDALREQMRANRAALAALDTESAGYSVELEQAATEKGRLTTEATLLFSRVRSEVGAVLTEEQLAKAQRSQKRGKQRGRRGGAEKRDRANSGDDESTS